MSLGIGYRISVDHWWLHSWSFTQRPRISSIKSRKICFDTLYPYDLSTPLGHLLEATHSRKVYTTLCRHLPWNYWQNISYIGLDTNGIWLHNA